MRGVVVGLGPQQRIEQLVQVPAEGKKVRGENSNALLQPMGQKRSRSKIVECSHASMMYSRERSSGDRSTRAPSTPLKVRCIDALMPSGGS